MLMLFVESWWGHKSLFLLATLMEFPFTLHRTLSDSEVLLVTIVHPVPVSNHISKKW